MEKVNKEWTAIILSPIILILNLLTLIPWFSFLITLVWGWLYTGGIFNLFTIVILIYLIYPGILVLLHIHAWRKYKMEKYFLSLFISSSPLLTVALIISSIYVFESI